MSPDGPLRVQVIEPGDGPAAQPVVTTVELARSAALLFLVPFLDDGYTVLVQTTDGTGRVLQSLGDLPRDARSILIRRAGGRP
jgi:hypothetical protein